MSYERAAFVDEFELPVMITVNGMNIEAYGPEVTVRITAEPDETIGDADWYISRVEVQGYTAGKRDADWFPLPDGHPIHRQAVSVAYERRHDHLDRKWRSYLADLPRRKQA